MLPMLIHLLLAEFYIASRLNEFAIIPSIWFSQALSTIVCDSGRLADRFGFIYLLL
jgi:hypothetical protein